MRLRCTAVVLTVLVAACGALPSDAGPREQPVTPTSRPVATTTLPPTTTITPADAPSATTIDPGDDGPNAVSGPWDALAVVGSIDIATASLSRLHTVAGLSRYADFTETTIGICVVELFDDADNLLDIAGFTPAPDSAMETASFNVTVPLPDVGIRRAAVSCDGDEIGSVEVGSAAPTVTITSPQPGDVLDAATGSVAWTGSDPDGDDLTYTVLYSADDGGDWQALTASTTATELTLERTRLQPSERARFLVTASDGLNPSRAVSEPFTLLSEAPTVEVHLEAPSSGRMYTGHQMVNFHATVIRWAGAIVGDVTVTWSSDIDGPLDSTEGEPLDGEYAFSIAAVDLSEGVHVITVTVTDHSGPVYTDTVDIEIKRSPT